MISNLRAHALVGLTVGWLAAIAALNLPWIVITLGAYSGNIMRP